MGKIPIDCNSEGSIVYMHKNLSIVWFFLNLFFETASK